ncbi:MAG TPA: DUF58 domain-containing protein [Alphaproteobacteria bacterium]|nr:DUF58 domain-containing protein [Alphaproteobacteria bacterium]
MTEPNATSLVTRSQNLAARLPPLLIAAERVASTVAQGVHGRRRTGLGEAFWQFRSYEPGDPPQRIDWRRSARSDRVFIRQTEWEAAQTAWLWRDGSPSMRYRSGLDLPEKRERAELLVLALASLLLRAGERVALMGSNLRPTSSLSTSERMALALLREPDPRSLPAPMELPRFSQIVLFGDFLSPIEEISAVLRPHAERGLRGHLLRVLDPAETSLPFAGRVRFKGLEGEGELIFSRVESIRQAYVERFLAHEAALKDLARAIGWSMTTHRTDQPAEPALLGLWVLLGERGA